jgi:hypothetical protein
MADIIFGNAATKAAVLNLIDDFVVDVVTGTFSSDLVTGVRQVKFTWSEFRATIEQNAVTVAAGSLYLNVVDVVSPTTYYIYCDGTSGTPVVTASTTSPITNPAVSEYFILGVTRFSSNAGTLVTFFAKLPSQDGIYETVHNLKEDVMFFDPIWMEGIAITMSAGGKISTDAGYVRFPGNEPRAHTAITEGTIAIDSEATVAGIDSIITYADGSAITATKWHKLLVGILRDRAGVNTTKYIVMRQSKPSVEYATAAAAEIDAESMAAAGFPTAYKSAVTPIFYLVTQVGDYTAAGFKAVDIRGSGIIKGAGGAATVSHHALADLTGYDDHTQYLKTDGTRALSGNWAAGAFTITSTKGITGETLASTIATGTAPLTVTSTTAVTNLNADLLDGNHAAAFQPAGSYLTAGGSVPLTADWDAGSFEVRAQTFESDVATGTAPFTVASTTVVANLNASALEGNAASAFAVAAKGVTNGDTHDHSGGDGAQIDHGGLAGLTDDDHTQYLLANGTRTLTGNLAVQALATIDGVDISVHAATANAHHDAITLSAAADGVLSLSTQQIGLDSQNASLVLAGPEYGSGPTAPSFRALYDRDITYASASLTLANGTNNNVDLATTNAKIYIVTGPTGGFTVTGFTGGYDGRQVTIYNPSGSNDMSTANESASSTAANRIVTCTNGTISQSNQSNITLMYIAGTTNRWIVISTMEAV